MTVPPSPPPGAHGGWNPPPAGTDWSSAPPAAGYATPGYPPPGYPQGSYGQGGYPPPPPAPKPGTNGFAIAALIFGIIGGAVLGIIFGIIGLNQTKKTGQKGRGLAVAGLVLSGVWVLGLVAVAVVAFSTSAKRDDSGTIAQSGDVSATALRVGDCVNNIKNSDNLKSLPAVPCAVAHEGEVFAVFDLPEGPYPGDGTSVPLAAGDECTNRFDAYAPNANTGKFALSVVYPLPANWALGDRTVDCIATSNGGPTTGSLKGS